MASEQPQVGSHWAYRARGIDPLVEVEVSRQGTQTPARTLVRLVDRDAEGREEWVPPARLKALWDARGDFEATEARWAASRALGDDVWEHEWDAATETLDPLVPSEVAEVVGWSRRESGLRMHDVEALSRLCGLASDDLQHPVSFVEDGAVIAPWPIFERVVVALARRHPDKVMAKVLEEERVARQEAIHGHHYRTSRRELGYIEPERCVEYDREHRLPVRTLLRSWCGAEGASAAEELQALRVEIRRVGELAERAIQLLREAGGARAADGLERQLGVPVERLRVQGD